MNWFWKLVKNKTVLPTRFSQIIKNTNRVKAGSINKKGHSKMTFMPQGLHSPAWNSVWERKVQWIGAFHCVWVEFVNSWEAYLECADFFFPSLSCPSSALCLEQPVQRDGLLDLIKALIILKVTVINFECVNWKLIEMYRILYYH